MLRTNFDKLLDKATSHLKLEIEWPLILEICDHIRQGDVALKDALQSIKKKIEHDNPHTAFFGLLVLESCVKNCGHKIHDEIGTTAFMTQLREWLKTRSDEKFKDKILELIQAWAFAFRNSPKYRAVTDTMNILKTEEYKFPPLKESDAMFSADTAPDWVNGDVCHHCRTTFSFINRKHHCRACGQIFCGTCASKMCPLPKFGLEKEVRVCDPCYNKYSKPSKVTSSKSEELPPEYLNSPLSQQSQAPPPRKSEDEIREEEELQLALALSQSEAEHKDKQRVYYGMNASKIYPSSPNTNVNNSSPSEEEVDPELARYLNRSNWDNRQHMSDDHNSPSAPTNLSNSISASNNSKNIESAAPDVVEQNGVESDSQMEEFISALQSQVEIFVNRMKSNSSRGRSITNDSSVQTLFLNITQMHSKLLTYIQQQDDSRVYFEGLQDKLAQVKDARAALNALRDEHREKLRREAEMAERQKQMQMAQKLDIMRKKKQEYLLYQRQLALQRIQEQEREMKMRQEQQKQMYLIGNYNKMGYIPPGQNYDGQSLPTNSMAMLPPLQGGYPSTSMPPPGSYGYPGMQPNSMMAPGPHHSPQHMMDPRQMMPHMMMVPPGQVHGVPLQNQNPPQGVHPQQMQVGNPGQPSLNQNQHIMPNIGQQQPNQIGQFNQPHPSVSKVTVSAQQNQPIMSTQPSQNPMMMNPVSSNQNQNGPIIQNHSNPNMHPLPQMVPGGPHMMMPQHLSMQAPHPQSFQQPQQQVPPHMHPQQQQIPPQMQPQPHQQVMPQMQTQPQIPQSPSQEKVPETAELISFD